jgi:sterol desaturase/sphingolipid hydroxylase (fatty acid hydroxylase superfamily)
MIGFNSFSASILICYFILYGMEYFMPLVSIKRSHFWTNIGFTLCLLALNLSLATVTIKLSDWIEANNIGLFNNLASPIWVQIVVCILFLDLWAGYFVHWIHHKIVWLWHAHSIHHSDDFVDVTTSFRKHPVESIVGILLNFSGMVILGISDWMLLIYLSLSTINSLFEHANIKLPTRVDHILQWFIVTPNMHKIHHSIVEADSHSNYGNIFSIWDRIFGSFRNKIDYSEISYGLNYLKTHETHSLWNLLKLPFKYWKKKP